MIGKYSTKGPLYDQADTSLTSSEDSFSLQIQLKSMLKSFQYTQWEVQPTSAFLYFEQTLRLPLECVLFCEENKYFVFITRMLPDKSDYQEKGKIEKLLSWNEKDMHQYQFNVYSLTKAWKSKYFLKILWSGL